MRRLFLKIFLSVLLAVTVAFTIGMAISSWARPLLFASPDNSGSSRTSSERANEAKPRGRWGRPSELLSRHARTAVWLIRNVGFEAAGEFVDRLSLDGPLDAYLIDDAGEEVNGSEVPAILRPVVERAAATGSLEMAEEADTLYLALRAHQEDGREYVFAGTLPLASARFARYRFWKTVLTLAPVLIALVIVCYVVAGYISRPVLKLRVAAQRFADGDLDHRVVPAIGHRRDELGDLARDFDRMAERIAALLATQRRLLRDISHELRSPLARQAVALELARQQTGPEAADALARVGREADRLGELVSELLTLTRLEDDGHGEERTPVELDHLIREVAEESDLEARNRGCTVAVTRCQACVVVGVPTLLRRALENVVGNAVAYTASGTQVDLTLETQGIEAVIRVRDRGPGVPEAELNDIFRAFYRLSHGRERQSGGVGLGLAITERAIVAHRGSVSAMNAPDGGLIVEMRLPVSVGGGTSAISHEPRTSARAD